MTKAQLIEALAPYPDNMEVFLADRKTEFDYGALNSVSKKKVNFMEEPGGKILASTECVILDEE